MSSVMTTGGDDATDVLFAASVAVAVKELAPSDNTTFENEKFPELSAVTVSKDVSPLNSSTSELASAVPTMLTGEDVTVVVELVITGAAGGVMSSVIITADDATDVLFDTSVAVAVKELTLPASSTPENEKVPEPLVVVVPTDAPSLNSSTSE